MKAIIFDFWGTLVELGVKPSPIKQIKSVIAPKMGYTSFVVLFEQSFMTKKFDDLYEAFGEVLKNFGKPKRKDVLDKLVAIWNKNKLLAKPFPETIETLERLKENCKLAITANTDSLSVPMVIEKYKIDRYMDCIEYSFEIGALKSSGLLLKKCMKDLSVKKEDIIVVGDSLQSDIEPARKLGLRAILIDRKNTRDYEEKISNLNELLDVVG